MAAVNQILCPRCHQPNPFGTASCQHCGFDMVLNNPGPQYYITRIVKAGGQGAVYEALGDDGQTYAVKEMLDQFDNERERDDAIQRFEAEVALLRRLSHPRIPRIYRDFTDENRHYLVMDFVHGEDLEDLIKRRGRIPEAEVLPWADQLCDVLGYLHGLGLIYRDVKPSNAILAPDGGIKMVDFGIARVFQPEKNNTMIGTPGYAPPEQYQGKPSQLSDIYALAATLHHLLTGRDPRDNPPFNFPAARDVNPAISERTSAALVRALSFRPEERWPTMKAFCESLHAPSTSRLPLDATAANASAPTRPNLPRPSPPAAPAQRRGGIGRWLIGLVLVAVLGGVGVVAGGPILQQFTGGPTATPQTFVQQSFTVQNVIVIMPQVVEPSDVGLQQAFANAFAQAARQQFGPNTQVKPGSLSYPELPKQVGQDTRGVQYQATVTGTILVLKQ